MPVPKWLLVGLGVLAAFVVGGFLRAAMADDSQTTEVARADRSAQAPVAPPAQPAAPPIYLTVVVPGAPVGAEGSAASFGPGGAGGPAGANAYAGRATVLAGRPRQMFISSTRSPGRSVAWASSPMRMRRSDAIGYTFGAPTQSVASTQPRVTGVSYVGGGASFAPPASRPVQLQGVQGLGSVSINATGSIIANGTHIVIANNGSIVSVGDNTIVTANTGDAGASGVIALDVNDSAVTSGTSDVSGGIAGASQPPPGSSSGTEGSASSPSTSTAVAGGTPGTRAVAIAGYQDRTLEVVGNGNLLTRDDSNIFYLRTGHLNGNTGDTDTSGLNVVDATGSLIRSGNSGLPPAPAPGDQASVGSSVGAPAAAPAPGAATASVAPNGTATATGADSLAIGGPGVVDTSMRVHGSGNVATSDDGNVTVGGVGDVNAQVGDSDTSGAVVMDVTGSEITTGNSMPPPAGTPPPAPTGSPPSQPPSMP